MKKLLAFLFIMAAATAAHAQNIKVTPPRFTSSLNTQAVPINLIGTGVNNHQFQWNTVGTVSSGSCALQGSADGVTFGTTIIAAQAVTASGGPTTLTAGVYNYVRLSCTTPIMGSGSVTITYFGYSGAGQVVSGTVSISGTVSVNVVTISAAASGPQSATNSDAVVQSFNTLGSGSVTLSTTGSSQVIPGVASNYWYITACTTSNASLTVSTDILLQDGSGGTTLWKIPTPAATVATTGGGGAVQTWPTPLKVPTSGNGLYAANVTSNTTQISCSGWRSTISY